MKPIKITIVACFLIISGAWLLADTLLPEPFTYFSFRSVFVQYTGVISIAAMSLSMVLATRPVVIERYLNGLDKSYRLHKWLGITALTTSVIHWWWAKGTKWMVGWGWLERPQRGPRPAPSAEDTAFSLEQFLGSQRGLAETVGEWTFYAALILMVLALVKFFPYRLFQKTHKWLALLYVALAFHALILVKFDYWSQPIGWITAVLLIAGLISAAMILTNRVGASRKVKGSVQSLTHHANSQTIEGVIKLDDTWGGHQPGQFAFVSSSTSEGPHPYTIASPWDAASATLTFMVKELGDWTTQIKHTITEGSPVTVEGPYGNFTFKDDSTRQIWIGAGIGITPFIAKVKALAASPCAKQIDLYYITAVEDAAMTDPIKQYAEAANINLHIYHSEKSGRFSPEVISDQIESWHSTSVWYCGPRDLGTTLKQRFKQQGLPSRDFHQELFNLR